MGSRFDRKRMNVEGDRLSSLPDDLIHKILSFIGTKQAIETSVLSSRWRYIWTSMPCLSFSSQDFDSLPKCTKFVKSFLSGRNNQIEVSSVELRFRGGKASEAIVKRILDYAFAHNVQELDITCLYGRKTEFPFALITSQSFKHLTLRGQNFYNIIKTPPTWELPALATLNLYCVSLYDDSTNKCFGLFSKCVNLKNLTLMRCIVMGSSGFNISHPELSTLTLEYGCNDVDVVTPQLKSLTVNICQRIHLISAPNLSSLHYRDNYCFVDGLLKLSTDLFHLEKVDIRIDEDPRYVNKARTHKIVGLLERLHCVKFLTLNLELVKALSSYVGLISHQPSPFVNLQRLKIYPADVTQPKVTMSTKVKNYFVDASPGATLTTVSHKEIRAVMNVTSARNLMGELQLLLDEWKEYNEANTAHVKQGEVENHSAQQDTEMKCFFGERMAYIESYWEVLNGQLERGYKRTRRTISKLRKIERVLKKVPRSDRAKLQARFSDLCAEAETIMGNVMDRVKIQSDKRPSC